MSRTLTKKKSHVNKSSNLECLTSRENNTIRGLFICSESILDVSCQCNTDHCQPYDGLLDLSAPKFALYCLIDVTL